MHPYTPADEFAALIGRRSAPIKAVLLNQSVAAGVGNWVADEVLYHAKIHPEQPASSLAPPQMIALQKALGDVIKTACDAGADADLFPDDWIFHHRWGKVEGNKVGGKAISFITVGGRTTAFVSSVQKKTSVKPAAAATAAAAVTVGGKAKSAKGRGKGAGGGGDGVKTEVAQTKQAVVPR